MAINEIVTAGAANYINGMRVIQERDGGNTPIVAYTRGIDLSGSFEDAGGIGGLLARSEGYDCADSFLTIRITNDTAYCLYDLAIWDSYSGYVSNAYVGAGEIGEFRVPGVPGRDYHIYAYSCDYYFIQVFVESFTASLDTHSIDFAGTDGSWDDDSGAPLCSDYASWPHHDYYFADGNGNIVTLIDTNQSVSASYRYDPFGNITSQSGAMADANVYRFSSKEFHAASGLYYYGYRFYDPNLQRWVNRDPLGSVADFLPPGVEKDVSLPFEFFNGTTLYHCTYNNPVSRIDPLGLDIWIIRDTCGTWGHEWVVGSNGDGTYWQSDKNAGSGGLRVPLIGSPLNCPADTRFYPHSTIDPNNLGSCYKIRRHIVTSGTVDAQVRDKAKANADANKGRWDVCGSNCRDYANGLANYTLGAKVREMLR